MPSTYTQTLVIWEAHQPQNEFGDMHYLPAVGVKARREDHVELVKTAEGKEVLSKHIFYVAPPEGLLIENADKLDGELVVSKYVMRKLSGKPKMVKFITV